VEEAVGDVRRLGLQGGTHIVTLPLHMVKAMGVKRGDMVLLEQPFMNSIILRGLMVVREGVRGDEVRSLGWITERERLDRLRERVPLLPVKSECSCAICRRWRGESCVVELPLCKWCLVEMANVVAFRSQPSQLEMSIV
jgi:hypothetical protein